MILKIANTMIKNLGKLSKNQRKWLAANKGKLSEKEKSLIREIHNQKGQMIQLDSKVNKGTHSPFDKEAAATNLDNLQMKLHSKAMKVAGRKPKVLK